MIVLTTTNSTRENGLIFEWHPHFVSFAGLATTKCNVIHSTVVAAGCIGRMGHGRRLRRTRSLCTPFGDAFDSAPFRSGGNRFLASAFSFSPLFCCASRRHVWVSFLKQVQNVLCGARFDPSCFVDVACVSCDHRQCDVAARVIFVADSNVPNPRQISDAVHLSYVLCRGPVHKTA